MTIKIKPILVIHSDNFIIPTNPLHKVHMVVKYRKSILHLLYFPPKYSRYGPELLLEIAKPKPVPPCARARALSTR